MRIILDMASGENLTDDTGYTLDRKRKTPRHERQLILQAPRASLATTEINATSTNTSLAGIDVATILRFAEE